MKRIIVLTAVTTTILLGGSQSNAWAGGKTRQDEGDYRAFKKIVRILDTLINDDHQKGRTQVIVKTYSFPKKKVCYYNGPYEVCQLKKPGFRRHQYQAPFKRHPKEKYYNRKRR